MNDHKIDIELRYDDGFRDSVVEHSRSDPLVGTKVRIGESYVFGDETHVNSDYMSTNLTVQLEAVEQLLAGEKVTIEYTNGPMWLVFEPAGDETVKITGCSTFEGAHDPDKRLSIDSSAVVSIPAWVAELIRTAEEFHSKLVELNPELKDDRTLQRLREAIQNAKNQLERLERE